VSERPPLAQIIRELERADIPHMLAGSFASTYHGDPRTTAHIDVAIDPDRDALDRFLRQLDPDALYASREAAAEAWRRRGDRRQESEREPVLGEGKPGVADDPRIEVARGVGGAPDVRAEEQRPARPPASARRGHHPLDVLPRKARRAETISRPPDEERQEKERRTSAQKGRKCGCLPSS